MNGSRKLKREILIAEDDRALSGALKKLVESFGYNVTHVVATVEDGIALAQSHTFDGALLDVALANGRIWPLANLLSERGVPYILMTGDPDAGKYTFCKGCRCIPKTRLVRTIRTELASLFPDDMLDPKDTGGK